MPGMPMDPMQMQMQMQMQPGMQPGMPMDPMQMQMQMQMQQGMQPGMQGSGLTGGLPPIEQQRFGEKTTYRKK